MNETVSKTDLVAMTEVQLILAEKRTSLAILRTGIAILALPLSIMSVLIATSELYDVFQVLHFLVPIGFLNLALIVFGLYLIIRSLRRMRRYDRIIYRIKLKHSVLAEFIE